MEGNERDSTLDQSIFVKRRFHDWVLALLAASALLALAALVVFGINPGGFEGQIGWFFALMPGAIFGLPFADRVYKIAPHAEGLALWGSTIAISLVWYFAISYAAIRAYRFINRTS